MKKIFVFIILCSTLLLTACTESYSKTHKKIAEDYKHITLESYLTPDLEGYDHGKVIRLDYNDTYATLIQYKNYYVIDFDLEKTYLYNQTNQEVIRYTDTIVLDFTRTSETVIDFIFEVERAETITFKKYSYLIFDMIRSALDDNHKSYIAFNQNRPNRGYFYPSIIIHESNYDKIEGLLSLLDDFDDTPEKIEILLDKHSESTIYIKVLNIDIHDTYEEGLLPRIKSITENE